MERTGGEEREVRRRAEDVTVHLLPAALIAHVELLLLVKLLCEPMRVRLSNRGLHVGTWRGPYGACA